MMTKLIETVATGLGAGVLSGLFGIGGGLITTPAIRLLLGYPALIAVGTPLAVIVPTTITGAWRYARMGDVDIHSALVLGGTGALGAIAGAYATRFVGGAIILILTALLLLDNARRIAWAPPPEGGPRPLDVRGMAALGVLAGLFSGFFGVGGGAVMIPALVRAFGRPMRQAIGTSLAAISLIALPGIAVHAALGHIDWRLAGLMVVGVVPGAYLGARIAYLASEQWLKAGFAVFLVATAVVLASSELAGLVRAGAVPLLGR
jgi:uncharacterized protein